MTNITLQYLGVAVISLIALIWIIVKVHKAKKSPSSGCSSCPLGESCNSKALKSRIAERNNNAKCTSPEKK
ncbi:MAG: hypothetical protein J6C81_00210 [Muribaculaceae bacterium]|nr:hypothetical protein [Muribaculaceae bacterium]